MTNDSLIQSISSLLPEAQIKMGFEYVEVFIPVDKLHDFMLQMKNNPEMAFDYLFCLTGADFPDHLQVIYHLESTLHDHILVVKVKTDGREKPAVDSVSDIWPTADPHENEVFDLLGIKFNNHPEPRRLFLDDTWGYPLRKDYQDDVHIVSR
jgi:NADH:ubiquinone oxidoreductase subunit C